MRGNFLTWNAHCFPKSLGRLGKCRAGFCLEEGDGEVPVGPDCWVHVPGGRSHEILTFMLQEVQTALEGNRGGSEEAQEGTTASRPCVPPHALQPPMPSA